MQRAEQGRVTQMNKSSKTRRNSCADEEVRSSVIGERTKSSCKGRPRYDINQRSSSPYPITGMRLIRRYRAASPVRWRPAAESMVFFAGLACPPVNAMEGKPDSVDVDERQQNDDEPDEHAEATEVAVSQSGGGQGDEGLEQAAPKRLFGVEVPEDDIAGSEKDGHEEETDEHGGSVEENRVEAAFQRRSCFASPTFERGESVASPDKRIIKGRPFGV